MELFKRDEAEHLINLLHVYNTPYMVSYQTEDTQKEGLIQKWTFEFDAKNVVMALLKP